MITPKKVEAFLEHHGVAYSPRAGNKWILDGCPFNPDHVSTASKPVVVDFRDGLLSFQCFHASCADNHWLEFRKKIEATSGKEKFYFAQRQLPSVAWGGKFHLIPKENKLDPQLLQAAKDYWAGVFDRKTGVSMDGAFTYRAEDINRRLLREGLVLMGSVTKIVRQAYVLFYNFKCLACHEDAHQALEPLRMVYHDTLRRPPTQCQACVAKAARAHDESELDRAIEYLERKIKPGTTVDAMPIIEAAASMSLTVNHLTRARAKLGITSIKVGAGWKWLRPALEDASYIHMAQGWYAFEKVEAEA